MKSHFRKTFSGSFAWKSFKFMIVIRWLFNGEKLDLGDAKTLSGHFHGLYLRLNITYKLNEHDNASGWKVL